MIYKSYQRTGKTLYAKKLMKRYERKQKILKFICFWKRRDI